MSHFISTCLVFVFVLNVLSCQTIDKLELIEYTDLSYIADDQKSQDTLQQLNLIIPATSEPMPLLIWIGGGAWSYGDKDEEMNLARKLAQKGIAIASVGHRLSPATWRDPKLSKGVQHPAHVQDIASAIRWLYDHADHYGYDRSSLFVGGYSSGAHLAALIALDERYLINVGLSSEIIDGVIPISGTYDIIDYHRVMGSGDRPELAQLHVEAVFGSSSEGMIQASPITYLDQLSTPLLVICDNNLYNYTRLLEDKIRAREFRDVQVHYAYDLSHGGLWRHMSHDDDSIYRQIIVQFINDKTKNS